MKDEAALAAFSALANPTRLKMVRALVAAGPSGLGAGDLAAKAGASPSRASFHLAAMAEAGLVTAERRARAVVYRADFTALGALVAFVLEDCCGGHPEVRACCGVPLQAAAVRGET
ncbi:MAG: metalloregulator ArsR/SmtB family transcription factor [Pseudomonadota bacterium]